MTEDNCRVDGIQHLMDVFRTSRLLLAFGPRKFRRFDFTGRVDRQDALFGRPGKHHSNSASAPPIISETPQYPEFGLPFSSPAPGPIPSWFIHELKTSAPAIARSARNQEPVRRLINANIIEESEPHRVACIRPSRER